MISAIVTKQELTGTVTPLKEAWKWSLGPRLATHLGRALDSGAFAPLMITLNMEYADDNQVSVNKHFRIKSSLYASFIEIGLAVTGRGAGAPIEPQASK